MRSDKARSVLALVGAGALLRLVFFDSRSLWFDEAITLRLASLPWGEIPARAALMEATPPLHPLLLKAWSGLFTDPLLGIRAFSWACGVASLPLYFVLCRRLAGERWREPALLGAASSFWIHLSQDGRCYSLLLLLSLAHALLLLDLLERPGRRAWAAYAALTAVGLYTHNFFALTLAAHGAWALGTRARAAWLGAAAAASVAWPPWGPRFLSQLREWGGVSVLVAPAEPTRVVETMGTWLFDPAFFGLALGSTVPLIGAAAALLLAASAPALLRLDVGRLCLVLGGGPILAAFIVESVLGAAIIQTRYLAACSPFFYILMCEAAHSWGGRTARWLRLAVMGAVVAGAATYLGTIRLVDPRLPALSAAVLAATGPAGTVVHLEAYYYLPLRYYYLPGLTHYLPPGEYKQTHWEGHPGYPAILPPGGLRGLGRVAVLDPMRGVFPDRLSVMDGAALEAALARQ